jgi:tRNA G18 (ribose-2'-O)-methylase SpoU
MASKSSRKRDRRQSMLRYERHRRRNALADPGVHEFIVVLDHLKAGFNVPKIFRSAEIFGAHEVHLINIGPFDPAAAKGGFKNVPTRFFQSFDDCYRNLQERGYTLFTLEAVDGESLMEAELPQKSAFIFGHEEMGISFDREAYTGIRCLSIPQFGEIESLNVSVAASIVMYEYVRTFQSRETPG